MKIDKCTREKFTPIEVTFTIETEEELLNIVKRLNTTPDEINKMVEIYPHATNCNGSYELWAVLDKYVENPKQS